MSRNKLKKIASDLLPPIALKAYRYLKGKVNQRRKSYKTKPAPDKFVSPLLESYAQYQEDLFIDAILGSKRTGCYVDVGANDPTIISNTKRFYQRGWRGINIEPNIKLHQKLLINRPRDINLNIGIASVKGEITFYEMSADTLSSFDREAALAGGKVHGAHLIEERKVKVLPLADVFQRHLKGRKIDFLSVDVEGRDLDVLQSNDWKKFRPMVLLVEIMFDYDDIVDYLKTVDYSLIYFNGTNGFFTDDAIERR